MVYLDQMPTRTFDAIVPYGVKYVLQRNPLQGLHMSNEYRYTCNIDVPTQNLNVSFCSCLCPIHWSQVLSQDWRCNWSSADRRCSSYVWMMNNVIAYQVAFCIRGLTIWQERLNVVTKLKNVKLNIYIYIAYHKNHFHGVVSCGCVLRYQRTHVMYLLISFGVASMARK